MTLYPGRRLPLVFAVLIAGSTGALRPPSAHAQVARVASQPAMTFRAVSELQPPAGAQTAMIGGRPARPQDWPASFYSFHGGGACTSTLVGPRAMLTAAHCVTGAPRASIVYKGQTYQATCSFSAAYNPDDDLGATADWALCLLDRALTDPQMTYERVTLDPAAVRIGTPLLLTGFGCVNTNLTGGNDGIFRVATAPVNRIPSRTSYDIVIKVNPGEPTVCPGDSGGGAYLVSADGKSRVQVSVNSRTGVTTLPGGDRLAVGESYLSSLSVEPAKLFVEDWMRMTNQTVCGVSPAMQGCRTAP